jgi:hypothetical protein
MPRNPFSTSRGLATKRFGSHDGAWFESDAKALKREQTQAEDSGDYQKAQELSDRLTELEHEDPEEI